MPFALIAAVKLAGEVIIFTGAVVGAAMTIVTAVEELS
jgi:hypothetical protein